MFTRNQSYAFFSKLQSIIENVKTTRLNTPYRLIVGIALGGVTQKHRKFVTGLFSERNKRDGVVSKKIKLA